MRKFHLAATATALFVSAASCGPERNNGVVLPNNGVTTNNGSTAGTNNGTISPNNGTGGTNNLTTSTNNGVDPNLGCATVEEFSNESFVVEREFRATESGEVVSCAGDVGEIATSGTYIARVTFEAATTVDIGVLALPDDQGGIPPRPVIEVRKGICDADETEVILCESNPSPSFEAEAGVPYFIVANGLADSAGLELSVDADIAKDCTPGETTCTDGTVEVCRATGVNPKLPCPGDCAGDGCAGETCDAPVTLSLVPNGPAEVLSGERLTFTNTWNAVDRPGCATDFPIPTPYPEFFVLVEGVSAGQTLVMDAADTDGRWAFFVIDSCEAAGCIAAYDFDEIDANVGRHPITEDGDVLVVIEGTDADEDRDFAMEIYLTE